MPQVTVYHLACTDIYFYTYFDMVQLTEGRSKYLAKLTFNSVGLGLSLYFLY